uniref:Uncharacterized protein n=1 Tax=Rhizophora mucronata TaxID=61149 RepID=A0A2P2NMS5_RHIMU
MATNCSFHTANINLHKTYPLDTLLSFWYS